MTARILVVDDLLVNLKLLEARLTAEYFDVVTATSGHACLDICSRESVDIILLDVMMPGLDGFETCRKLKAGASTRHIPVIMVTSLDQTGDRIRGLEAGADDFLTKPVDDVALITRVRNLARIKMLNDEMIMRATTHRSLGVADEAAIERALADPHGRIMIIDDNPSSVCALQRPLRVAHRVEVEGDAEAAILRLSSEDFNLAIVSLGLTRSDGLRVCSQLRTRERTRHLPIIMVVDAGNDDRLLRGLDLGVTDYLIRPVDRQELMARVGTQLKRNRYTSFLRNRLETCVELSVMDQLTGLFNRHYLDCHLSTLVKEAKSKDRPLSLLMIDIDHFKDVNDTYGHKAGDEVLQELAGRLRSNTRSIDLTARVGGEEFIIAMPDTDVSIAHKVGERLRACIADVPFALSGAGSLVVTVSMGVSGINQPEDTPDEIARRADMALYAAKRLGRNRVADAA